MLVEIVSCSAEDCVSAEVAGANRIELCQAIELGGLTPSVGLVKAARAHCKLPIMAMIRPRGAGFCYTDYEFESMLDDVLAMKEAGVEGVVTGALLESGELDSARLAGLRDASAGMTMVLHRCYDATPNAFIALEMAVNLGIDRILTSGQAPRAVEAVELIKGLVELARGRIEILPAGGLRAHNIPDFLAATGCNSVHLAPFEWVPDASVNRRPSVKYGIPEVPSESHFRRISQDAVRAVTLTA